MRKMLTLFFLGSCSLVYALNPVLEEKYRYKTKIEWGFETSSEIQEELDKGKFQEAIWLLEKLNDEKKARVIKTYLRDILETEPFKEDGILPLGGGATETKLVYLKDGIKGVYKRCSVHPSSNCYAEVGAYEINELGQFSLVPMTVFRKNKKGKILGSLQYFVADSFPIQEDYIPSFELRVFDYIIRNFDRTKSNILIYKNKELAIDHGLALNPHLDPKNALGNFLRLTDLIKLKLGIDGDPIRMKRVFPKDIPSEFVAESKVLKALYQSKDKMKGILRTSLDDETIEMVQSKVQKLFDALAAKDLLPTLD